MWGRANRARPSGDRLRPGNRRVSFVETRSTRGRRSGASVLAPDADSPCRRHSPLLQTKTLSSSKPPPGCATAGVPPRHRRWDATPEGRFAVAVDLHRESWLGDTPQLGSAGRARGCRLRSDVAPRRSWRPPPYVDRDLWPIYGLRSREHARSPERPRQHYRTMPIRACAAPAGSWHRVGSAAGLALTPSFAAGPGAGEPADAAAARPADWPTSLLGQLSECSDW